MARLKRDLDKMETVYPIHCLRIAETFPDKLILRALRAKLG